MKGRGLDPPIQQLFNDPCPYPCKQFERSRPHPQGLRITGSGGFFLDQADTHALTQQFVRQRQPCGSGTNDQDIS